jgi:NhaP-type Na+/H+ or K+/H+ antiporter
MTELASIIVLGIFAQWIAWRMKLPAILPLILIGLAVGPLSTLWNTGGEKWLEPIWNSERGLFPGDSLFYFVELAIGIILFEGGLTLKREEIKNVGPTIFNLVSLGAFVTFVGAAILTHYIVGLPWLISSLFAALVIVTGPTVIAPILRNVPLKRDVATVLKWEGILIDPIGALAAVLVFELIISLTEGGGGGAFTQHALVQFIKIAVVGTALGYLAAIVLKQLLIRKWIPHYLINVFTLAFVMLMFVESGIIVHDSGLLTVVVMGLALGNMDVPHLKEILDFKESLSILLISVLFILLSANINMSDLELLMDWKCIALFLAIILVVRPLGVFLSTRNSSLSFNDKLFISWVGPRGIVAAGIASLFGIKLMKQGLEGAEYITPLVFMVVLGTVLLNATTARFIARILGVMIDKSNGTLIIGANQAARLLAKYISDNGQEVALIDTNVSNIQKAAKEGLKGFNIDIYRDDIFDNLELNEMGYLMALTGSSDVNRYALNKFREDFGENGSYRLIAPEEMEREGKDSMSDGLFSYTDDYINFSEVARDYPMMNEINIRDTENYEAMILEMREKKNSIPIFIKDAQGELKIIPSHESAGKEISEGMALVYMGKTLNLETD